MEQLNLFLTATKRIYDKGGSPLDAIRTTVVHCLDKLKAQAAARALVALNSKDYWVATAGTRLSRPFLPALHVADSAAFSRDWDALARALNGAEHKIDLDPGVVNKVLYTSINAFCLCYDLWKPGSRKTPGTFLEVLLGTILGQLLPTHGRTKSIPIPNQTETVATDIVFTPPTGDRGLVFPAKITTRERIVQPFAHQRILDSVFPDRYNSVLLCVSEMQRDEEANANEICVPGPIRLYQSHLSKLSGI